MKIGKMKKLFIIFVTLFLSLSILYADDYQEPITLKTDITGVGSYKNFGLGLAPVSTTFEYYRTDLDWFELSKFKSQFYFNLHTALPRPVTTTGNGIQVSRHGR